MLLITIVSNVNGDLVIGGGTVMSVGSRMVVDEIDVSDYV